MNKFDLIVLKNEESYRQYNLKKGMHGIVLDYSFNVLDVLFFNPRNQGDYVIQKINSYDIEVENEKLPENLLNDIKTKFANYKNCKKTKFEPLTIREYDKVELMVEDKKYTKFGIHKGDVGCVMEDNAVQNYVEVDFSGIDENGNYYGDCISVKIDDLKLLK